MSRDRRAGRAAGGCGKLAARRSEIARDRAHSLWLAARAKPVERGHCLLPDLEVRIRVAKPLEHLDRMEIIRQLAKNMLNPRYHPALGELEGWKAPFATENALSSIATYLATVCEIGSGSFTRGGLVLNPPRFRAATSLSDSWVPGSGADTVRNDSAASTTIPRNTRGDASIPASRSVASKTSRSPPSGGR